MRKQQSIRYYQIQFEIAKANDAGDDALEIALLAEQAREVKK